MKGAMAENTEEKAMGGEGQEVAADMPQPDEPQSKAEPQSEAELERLIDKELEDEGNEEEDTQEKGDIDARQRAIDEELRKLREELEMDSTTPEPEEYDIGARVRQLNEELAKEGPAEEKKNRKVNFPDNIVSMAVPPAEYPEEEVAAANQEAERLVEEQEEDKELQALMGQDQEQGGTPDVREGWAEGDSNGSSAPQPPMASRNESMPEQTLESADDRSTTPMPSDSLPNRTEANVPHGEANVPPREENASSGEASVSSGESNQKRNETEPNNNQQQEPTPSKDATDGRTAGDANVENQSVTKASAGANDPNDLEVERLTLLDRRQQNNQRTLPQNSNLEGASTGQAQEDEHVLIERDGKFFYVNVQDLSPEEREAIGFGLAEAPSESKSQSELPSIQPRPPQKPRPATATGGGEWSHKQRQLPPRAMSAKTSKEYDQHERKAASYEEPFGNPRSRYGMTPEQKQHRREQARLRAQQIKEEKDREEQEKREKEEIADGAFKAWRENKKKEMAERRRAEKDMKKTESGNQTQPRSRPVQNEEERHSDEAFDAWLKRKNSQKRAEQKVREHLTQEERDAYFVRSRAECERAFREWRKSKKASLREAQSMSRAGSLESRKIARQSRKSRNLAKALEASQSYRYTDYYGYRL